MANATLSNLRIDRLWLLLAIAAGAIAFVFYDGFIEMEYRWANSEPYSHGYMIPLVALFLLWKQLPQLKAIDWQPTLLAPLFMAGAIIGWALGELSSLFIIVHYSFLLAVFALALAVYGWRGLRLSWMALLYLAFMIPFPHFIYNRISASLQLISTELGVAVIRLLDISVYVEGNVIDLGEFKLQVVEACSGLNYLFPLMSFGFLIACLYRGPLWHRWLIFLATIPITVLMNSFRIGVIGITVEYWGTEMAEGFLHDFEGWFVFMACVALLVLLIWSLNLFNKDGVSALNRIDLSYPSLAELRAVIPGARRTQRTLQATVVLLLLAVPASIALVEREETVPPRDSFVLFPLIKGEWVGREQRIDNEAILEELDLTDYIIADYYRAGDPLGVNFYTAFYASQRSGESIHSPRSCIPGGGWLISDLSQQDMGPAMGMSGLRVNRAIISLGEHRQLVYYWFQQRGRIITNEYLAKWYLFQDGLTMSRSDGALVRLITPVPPNTELAAADARLQDFLREFYPLLPSYLPGGARE